jgi:cytidine deaminase
MKCNDLKQRLYNKAAASTQRYKIGAIGLDRHGKAIVSGVNAPRFQRRFGGLHAEARILKSSPKSLKTIIIIRLGRNGKIRPIDPCFACSRMAFLRGVEIKTINDVKLLY